MSRRPIYVVWASDCQPTGILGAHTSRFVADRHHASVVEDRLRWYFVEWTREECQTRNDCTGAMRETEMVLRDALLDLRPATVTVRTVRCP